MHTWAVFVCLARLGLQEKGKIKRDEEDPGNGGI
jgi:hypothetical protein